ncbi:MAG: hypothetical protein QM657_17225 [Lacrimispora sp.]|uniref:hypothetical protein n=1 Tax=Lacrimispora sp. TaxID=2719234 RepID=UPI0039E5BD93
MFQRISYALKKVFYRKKAVGQMEYEPNPQSGNCIVASISNILWFWAKNGYDSLAYGMSFREVEAAVDALILYEGGYANVNIPATIKKYVKSKDRGYFVKVKNRKRPKFSRVKKETVRRPCLLGFAVGSPFSGEVGHMTVCVGTGVSDGKDCCRIMDGWSASVTEKPWGEYNDFIATVRMSKRRKFALRPNPASD